MSDGGLQSHFNSVRRKVAKWAHYIPIYESLLADYRGRPLTLVEVGVADGGSLEAWRSYLGPSARIIGIDIDGAATQLAAEGFEIIVGDQADPEFWAQHLPRIGPIDILIDDGGHSSVQQIVTVASAVPSVRDGGVIIVEDTHAAFMPKQYPEARGFGVMDFARHIADAMHARNPLTAAVPRDAMGFGRAIHCVQLFESMIVFHVDRRLCASSVLVEAGSAESIAGPHERSTIASRAVAAFEAQPTALQSLLHPVRRLLGVGRRSIHRIEAARRVRRYFR